MIEMEKPERVQKSIYIDKWLVNALAEIATENGISESEVYRKFLIDTLERKITEAKEWHHMIEKNPI